MSNMDVLASNFKEKSIRIINECLEKFREFKGQLPFKVEDLENAKTNYLMHMDGDCIVDLFIKNSADSWNDIKDRNEEALIQAFKTRVEEESTTGPVSQVKNPLADMIHSMMANMKAKILASIVPWLEFILKNRKVLFDESFENHLWEEVGELVRISLKFAHLKRNPKMKDGVMKYQSPEYPKLHIKADAVKWGVDLYA
jgi:hypothetical protein